MIDAPSVRDQQRETWDGVSAGWLAWRHTFERGARAVTARLLQMAGVAPGHRVLDVGSGVGEPALTAARAVGEAGGVVGVDLSPAMVEAAREAAAGLRNVEFVAGDLETADLPPRSFDAAVSRWALMFAADRLELLRAVARLLRPGAVLAGAVWGPPEQVPLISLAFRVIAGSLALGPPPPGPGPFTMSSRAAVAGELEAAGFGHVVVVEEPVPFCFRSVEDFARFSRDVLPPRMKRLLEERRGSIDDPAVWGDFSAAAAAFQQPDGTLRLPCSCLFLRAAAPAGR